MATVTVASLLPTEFSLQFVGEAPIVLAPANGDEPGLTPGVDADRFHNWMQQHATYAPVAAGKIYALLPEAAIQVPAAHAPIEP